MKAGRNDAFVKVKNVLGLKAICYSVLKKAEKKNLLIKQLEPMYEDCLKRLTEILNSICGLDMEKKLEEIDEPKLKKEKYDRFLFRELRKSYEEKLVDISDYPESLQKKYKSQKLVSVTAILTEVYLAGNPVLYNLKLKVKNYDKLICATVQEKHIKKIASVLKNFRGKIKVSGQVFTSEWHRKNGHPPNVIRSIDELEAVEIIDELPQVNTTLLLPDDDSPF